MNPLLLHLEKGHLPQGKRSHLISICLLARLAARNADPRCPVIKSMIRKCVNAFRPKKFNIR